MPCSSASDDPIASLDYQATLIPLPVNVMLYLPVAWLQEVDESASYINPGGDIMMCLNQAN